MDKELFHYGTPRHSGRYPWGSGDNPYQRSENFLKYVKKLESEGIPEKEIARSMDMSIRALRDKKTLCIAEKRSYDRSRALSLYNKGNGYTAIGRIMGIPESSVRSLLDDSIHERSRRINVAAQVLKDAVRDKHYIDVGAGVEQYLGVSEGKLSATLKKLKDEGYEIHNIPIKQLGTGNDTTLKVLCPPGTDRREASRHKFDIQLPVDYYPEDGGRTIRKVEPPRSVDPSRVMIRYTEDGGSEKDGVMELRRGVDDISLGNAKYAQVRVAVGGTHYLKGMAVYGNDSDSWPEGIDIIFNTNKHAGTPMLGPKDNTVLKPMKLENAENPFGATIKLDDQLIRAQRHYIDADGKEQLSCLNIVNEEGDWFKWGKNLSSQFLSKQTPALVRQQLNLAYDKARDEFDEINSLTNPTVKANLMEKFAGECDSDAVHLQAAALPRQATKVLIPFPNMSPHEIYAPHLKDGETVALVRFPHAGIFEIPTLTVNNQHKTAISTIGNATDAVGINHKVAEQLSGADFDGDSVVVIPIDNVNIKTKKPLKDLIGFDPKEAYPAYDGMHVMTKQEKGKEMGIISNLITDMTLKGAPDSEIVRAVKHSMVVIDAEKHRLDYKRSYIDNNIDELKQKYQAREDGKYGGAGTLISRAKSEERVPYREEKRPSKMTPQELEAWKNGEIIYETKDKSYSKPVISKKTGEVIRWQEIGVMEKSTKMQETSDARTLLSRSPNEKELIYADHANRMKALAKEARRISRNIEDIKYDPEARKVYAMEVASLEAKLNEALRNAPLERRAQIIANEKVSMKMRSNPAAYQEADEKKRLKGQELDAARRAVGSGKKLIKITDGEWKAINAGAVHTSKLKRILANADSDNVRQLATPKTNTGLSTAKLNRAKTMLAKGISQADVADILDISVSTLVKAIE